MGIISKNKRVPGLPCLICGVDSGPIRTFLLIFFGGFFLASLMIAVWAYLSGRFRDQESSATLALEAENRGTQNEN